jgi:hypothetical protein
VLIDPKFSTPICNEEETSEHEGGDRRSTLQLSSMLRRKMKKISRARAVLPSSSEEDTGDRDRDRDRALKVDQSPLMGLLRLSNLQVEDDGAILPRVSSSIQDGSLLPFEHIPKYFPLSHTDIPSDLHLSEVLANASFIIGVHPDQVTEAVVDIAIHLQIPFAVIPCCVFTKLFQSRKTPTGGAVRTYEELVMYLKGKHKNITQGILPFYGRNIVLYCTHYE